jgi:hypothetical protein
VRAKPLRRWLNAARAEGYVRDLAQADRHPSEMTLRCLECKRSWDDPFERWLVLVTDDEVVEIATYCPECAQREFGSE